jgi:hypothetical protein
MAIMSCRSVWGPWDGLAATASGAHHQIVEHLRSYRQGWQERTEAVIETWEKDRPAATMSLPRTAISITM